MRLDVLQILAPVLGFDLLDNRGRVDFLDLCERVNMPILQSTQRQREIEKEMKNKNALGIAGADASFTGSVCLSCSLQSKPSTGLMAAAFAAVSGFFTLASAEIGCETQKDKNKETKMEENLRGMTGAEASL